MMILAVLVAPAAPSAAIASNKDAAIRYRGIERLLAKFAQELESDRGSMVQKR